MNAVSAIDTRAKIMDNPVDTGFSPVVGFHRAILCRTAGFPAAAVAELHAGRALQEVDELLGLDDVINLERQCLLDALFKAIGTEADLLSRRRLLTIRRALMNGAAVSDPAGLTAVAMLPDEICARLEQLAHRINARECAATRAAETHRAELIEIRTRLQQLFRNPDFTQGVLLSSQALFECRLHYLDADVQQLSQRAQQIERGLLRYFARMATKGTPFSRFCTVISGTFQSGRPAVCIEGDITKHSKVLVNKMLFAPIWSTLLKNVTIRNSCQVVLNYTVTDDGDRLRFLSSVGDVEVFQRVERHDGIARVLELVNRSAGMKFGDLRRTLLDDDGIEGSLDEIDAYLQVLIDIGLLRLTSPISEQDAQWCVALAAWLDAIPDELAQRVSGALKMLHAGCARYEEATVDAREALLCESRALVEGMFMDFGIGQLQAHIFIYYEDATASAQLHVPVDRPLSASLSSLARLIQLLEPLGMPRDEQAAMRHYFDLHFSDPVQKIPLLDFYEAFFRDHYKEQLSHSRRRIRNRQPIANTFDVPLIEQRGMVRKALRDLVSKRIADAMQAEEVELKVEDFASILDGLPKRAASRPLSVAVFANPVLPATHDRRWRFVLSASTAPTGFGKYWSRFLHLFPEEQRCAIECRNHALSDDILAEVCNDGDFNGNLHPALLRSEIEYPTGLRDRSSSERLLCTDILVARDLTDPFALQLVHRQSGRRIWPVDLGFLNPNMRPALFQLLRNFSPVNGIQLVFNWYPQSAGVNLPVVQADYVNYQPRVTFEGNIVLSRRRWQLLAVQVPSLRKGERPFAYFLRIQRWRRKHGIPVRVFVRLTTFEREAIAKSSAKQAPSPPDVNAPSLVYQAATQPEQPIAEPALVGADDGENEAHPVAADVARRGAKRQRRSRDHQKPQFIDFSNACFVELFGRVAGDLKSYVMTIEEALPDLDQTIPAADGTYFADWLLEYDDPAEGGRLDWGRHV